MPLGDFFLTADSIYCMMQNLGQLFSSKQTLFCKCLFSDSCPHSCKNGGEWVSVLLGQRSYKMYFLAQFFARVYPAFIPFALPFSHFSVCVSISPCPPSFSLFLPTFLSSSLYLLHSLPRSRDMQMTRGLARQSDSTVPRSARQR